MKLRALRESLGMNQAAFWAKCAVTQSGGSRYENGRALPKPVQILVQIAYGSPRERARALKRLGAA